MSYEERTYRSQENPQRFDYFSSIYLETDLLIGHTRTENIHDLKSSCSLEIKKLRLELDAFISDHPEFITSMVPLAYDGISNENIIELLQAGKIAGTGPMAGIAGLFSKNIGKYLKQSYDFREIIVENGGDIFAQIAEPLKVSVYAGNSALSNKLGVIIQPGRWGICTSSGTVGHSKSFGKADALTIISRSPVIADTLATSLANRIQKEEDIEEVLEYSVQYEEIEGILIIVGDKVGIRGEVEIG